MLGTGLYFPHIDIEDSAWLRSAILFWDEIQTIAPSAIEFPYQNEDSRICSQEGYLRPLRVDLHKEQINELGWKILHGHSRKRLFRAITGNEGNKAFKAVRDQPPYSLDLTADRDQFHIHPQKIPYAIQQVFEGSNLLNVQDDGWYMVNRRFAEAYMSALATMLSKQLRLSPLTASENAHGMSYRFLFQESLADPFVGKKGAMVAVIMRGLVVDASVPISRLIAFRRRRQDQYLDFAAKIAELSDQLKIEEDDDAEALLERAQEIYHLKIGPALRALRRELDLQGIGAAWGGAFRALTLSASSASALGYFTAASTPVLLGAGVALTAADIYVQGHLASAKTRAGNPFSYLHDINDRFGLPRQEP